MGSPGKQLDKSACIFPVTASPSPPVVGDVADASFLSSSTEGIFVAANPPSLSSERNLTAASPARRDFPTLGFSELHLLPSSPSGSDVNPEHFSALGKVAACAAFTSPLMGNDTVHAMMHGPGLSPPQQSSAMEGSDSLSNLGNIAMHASPTPCGRVFCPSGENTVFASIRSAPLPLHGLDLNDGVQNFSPVLLSPELSRRGFMRSYVNNLLPELKRIHRQSSSIPLNEKLSAVKLAADMSLAISAGGNNTWSQALIQELASTAGSKLPLSSFIVRKKQKFFKKSSIFTEGFCARRGCILRNRPSRGGSHAVDLRGGSHVGSHVAGGAHSSSSSRGCLRMSKGSSHGSFDSSASILSKGCSHAGLLGRASCANSPGKSFFGSGGGDAHHPSQHSFGAYEGNLPQLRMGWFASKRVKRHQIGVSSYVKILRNSRAKRNCGGVKASENPRKEASSASLPPISKQHIESLGRLVPGGRNMDVPLLLQEAADYILSLQMQVEALQSLSNFVSL